MLASLRKFISGGYNYIVGAADAAEIETFWDNIPASPADLPASLIGSHYGTRQLHFHG